MFGLRVSRAEARTFSARSFEFPNQIDATLDTQIVEMLRSDAVSPNIMANIVNQTTEKY